MDEQEKRFELTEPDFLALLVKCEPALRAYARGLVPDWDSVDEALQEASVTMWQKRGQLQNADGFVLYRSANSAGFCSGWGCHYLERRMVQKASFFQVGVSRQRSFAPGRGCWGRVGSERLRRFGFAKT